MVRTKKGEGRDSCGRPSAMAGLKWRRKARTVVGGLGFLVLVASSHLIPAGASARTASPFDEAHARVEVTPEALLKAGASYRPDTAITQFSWSKDGRRLIVERQVDALRAGTAQQSVWKEYVDVATATRAMVGADGARSFDEAYIATVAESPDGGRVSILHSNGSLVCAIDAKALDSRARGIPAFLWTPAANRLLVAVRVAADATEKSLGPSENQDQRKAVAGQPKSTDRPTVRVYTEQEIIADTVPPLEHVAFYVFDTQCQHQLITEMPYQNVGRLGWATDDRLLLRAQEASRAGGYHAVVDLLSMDVGQRSWNVLRQNIGGQATERETLAISPDGEMVAFTFDPEGQPYGHREQIAVARVDTGEIKFISSDLRQAVEWLPDGHHLWLRTVAPHQSLTRAAVLSLAGEEQFVDDLPGTARLSPDGKRVAWTVSNLYGDSSLWVGKLDRRDGQWRVTHRRLLLKAASPLAHYARGERRLLQCQSTDNLKIVALLTLPLGYRAGVRYPLIVDIHGGPIGGINPQPVGAILNTTYLEPDMWATKGYVVLQPSYRAGGMYGFEASFAKDGSSFENDFKDIMCNVDALVDRGIVDNSRMAVIGHSYGGTETNWIISHSDRFRAAITYEGAHSDYLLNWGINGAVSRHLDIRYGSALQFPERYSRLSVLTAAKEITTPTMFVSGFGGRSPGDMYPWLFAALRSRGVEAQYRIYDEEPHTVSKPANVRDLLDAFIRWIDGHLSPQAKPRK